MSDYDITVSPPKKIKDALLVSEMSSITIDGLTVNRDENDDAVMVRVHFPSSPSQADMDAADQAVESHSYSGVYKTKFRESVQIIKGAEAIPGVAWALVGGVTTTPTFFVDNPALAFANVVGEIKAIGGDAYVRFVELDDDDQVVAVLSNEEQLGGGTDKWVRFTFQTSSPANEPGTKTFGIQAKLGTAVSGEIRFVSTSLMELVYDA